jgi:amino acid transporter
MRDAPWWVWSLITGVGYGVVMGFYFQWSASNPGTGGWILGLSSGVFFGAFMGPFAARQARLTRALMGPLSPEQRRCARRAATRGPVPEDADVRAAALRLNVHQLAVTLRSRNWGLSGLGLILAGTVVVTVSESAWSTCVVGVLLYAIVAGVLIYSPTRLRRQLARLEPATEQ